MQKSIIYLLMLFAVLFNNKVVAQSKTIEKYYDNIYRAENCIIKNKIDSSIFFYKKAFLYKKNPFSKDIYNAAIVAIKRKENKLVYSYVKILLRRGIGYEELTEINIFKVFFKNPPGELDLNDLKRTKITYSKSYRESLLFLVEEDQKFRKLSNSYKLYTDTIMKIDKENINAFFRLIKKYGFPSDDKVGVSSLSTIMNPIYTLLMVHQSAGPLLQFNLSSFLKENILNGNLDNKTGFYYLNRNNGNNFFDIIRLNYVKVIDSTKSSSNLNNIVILDSSNYGYFPIDEKMIISKNEERRTFYLDEYENNLNKILFSIKNPEYKFDVLGSISGINYTKYEYFLADKKNLKYFE